MKPLRTASRFLSILILICLLLAGSIETSHAIQHQAFTTGYTGDYFADLVVGVPGESVSTRSTIFNIAGLVHVIFGFPQGLDPQDNETWHQDMDFSQDQVESHDQFGRALVSGDFNGDGRYDVAVGVPFENITDGGSTETTAGGVHVIYGSNSGGLTAAGNQFWHQDSPNVAGSAEYNDQFGKALAVGNFNGDEYDDLAIGVPFEDFEYEPTINNGGSVIVLYGSVVGLSPTAVTLDQMWHQDSTDIIDNVEKDDNFGYALAAGNFDNDDYDDLAIGAFGEDSATKDDIGVVHVLYGTEGGLSAARNQQWEQYDWGGSVESESDDLFGKSLAVGDFDANGLDDLAVGVPAEDIVVSPSITIEDAGAVNILFGFSSGLDDANVEFLYQDGIYIVEDAEYRDQFGYTLAAVDFSGSGLDNLVVGVPFEDLGDPLVRDAGAVHVITRSGSDWVGDTSRYFHQNRPVIPDELERDDNFGYSLAPGDFNGDGKEDLAIGVPYDSCSVSDDGSVIVIYDDTWDGEGDISPQHWCQGGDLEDQGEAQDHFGLALTALPSSGALPYRNYLPIIMRDD